MRRKKCISLLLAAGLVVSMTGCQSSEEASSEGAKENTVETVRLGVYTGGMDQYLAVVGTEQGIFEEYGIELEITEFAAGINTVDAIVTGQADVGMVADFALVNRIGNTTENFDIRILGRFTTARSYNLYVNPNEVTELSDLAGKGVITYAGTIIDYYNALVYEKAEIAEEDQNIVSVDAGTTALSAIERGDAVASWSTGATAEKLLEAGLVEFLTMEDLGVSVDAYYVSSDSYIAEHADTLSNFLSAIAETEEWIADNQELAAEIMEENANVPQDQALQNIEANELLLDFKQDSVEHLNEIKEWALGAGLFESDYEITDFAETSVLEQLFPDEVE